MADAALCRFLNARMVQLLLNTEPCSDLCLSQALPQGGLGLLAEGAMRMGRGGRSLGPPAEAFNKGSRDGDAHSYLKW